MKNPTRQDDLVEYGMRCLESQTDPDGLSDLYLRTLVATASHLSDVITYLATNSTEICLGRWDLFRYMEICLCRLSDTPAERVNGEDWRQLYHSLQNAIKRIRVWSGEAATAVSFSAVLFVSSFILARLTTGKSSAESLGVEFAFGLAAAKVPFPIDLTNSLEEQARVAMLDLEWLDRKIPSEPGAPGFY